jgi:hypothetical protein
MSNLIDRDEVMKIIYECTEEYELHTMKNRILSLPLQQQWGNEKIKELIEKKIWSLEYAQFPSSKTKEWAKILKELLSEIDNPPPNN